MNIGTEYNVGYGYDGYGRLNQVTSGTDVFSYGYLANSDLVAGITRPGNLSTSFTFESNRNLITGVENKYDTTTVSAYGYANDAIGRRTSMSRLGAAFAQADVISYTYDDRSEVTGAVSNTLSSYDYGFHFDNIGNRLTSRLVQDTTSYTANNVNQYTAVTTGGNTFNPIHDDDGNTLSLSSNGSQWTLTWNVENRLIKAESATQKLEFSYDYQGRRVEKKVFQLSNGNFQLTKSERFVYDDFKLIEKLDGGNSNAIVQKFTWQPGVLGQDVPLVVFDAAANSSYFYQADANKNIGQLMDASGNLVTKYEYSPFGQLTSSSGSYAEANPFRFSSEYFDVETGLVYYNYRYYNVESGRWLSRDPIGEAGGLNLHGFIDNDVVNYWDYLGLDECPAEKKSQLPDLGDLLRNFINGMAPGNWSKNISESRNKTFGPFVDANEEIKDKTGGFDTIKTLDDLALALVPMESSLSAALAMSRAEATAARAARAARAAKAAEAAAKTAEAAAKTAKAAKACDAAKALEKAREAASTGRTTPNNLLEQMTMDAAKKGAGAPVEKMPSLSDPRFNGMEKMQYNVKSANGQQANVHYVKDPATGKTYDYKFKDKGK